MRKWWLLLLAAAVLIAAAGAAAVISWRSGAPRADSASPSATPTPDPVRTPLLEGVAQEAPVPTAAGLLAALHPGMSAPLIAGRLSVSIIDVASGRPLLEIGAARPVVPASTVKLVTAVAALTALPPDQRLVTRVLAGAAGDVVLVGGGDPTLLAPGERAGYPGRARLVDLASQVQRLKQPVRRVLVDDSLFSGPRLGPGWKPIYVSDGDVAPVSALELHGQAPPDPAIDAGRKLAALLHVTAPVTRGTAPAQARELARVSSPTVAELVELMLATSDNDLAEALGRQLALAAKQPPTFAGEVAAIGSALQPVLTSAGLAQQTVDLHDASGLSPLDHVQPAALSRLLALAARDGRYGPLLSGLPVAGFDGTLADRYRKGPGVLAAGQVRAKTGTLTGVSALAGLVRTRAGRLLAFDVTANGLPEKGAGKAPADLDAIAAALAGCGCP